jgi:hypothetical protein
MWSLRCALAGHDDRFSRTPQRLALQCVVCGRTTHGWQVGTTKDAEDRAHQCGAMLKERADRLLAQGHDSLERWSRWVSHAGISRWR